MRNCGDPDQLAKLNLHDIMKFKHISVIKISLSTITLTKTEGHKKITSSCLEPRASVTYRDFPTFLKSGPGAY